MQRIKRLKICTNDANTHCQESQGDHSWKRRIEEDYVFLSYRSKLDYYQEEWLDRSR